ncbi:ATP-binding cassette domain-containing protein [Paracoccaceae bacterium]|nr:ATP-binding cassette domain-containing protein [Paracoccaceae bacterium]
METLKTVSTVIGRNGYFVFCVTSLVSFFAALTELLIAIQLPVLLVQLNFTDREISSVVPFLKQLEPEYVFLITVLLNFVFRSLTLACNTFGSMYMGHSLFQRSLQCLFSISFDESKFSDPEKPLSMLQAKNQIIVNNFFLPIIMAMSNVLIALALIAAVLFFEGEKIIVVAIAGVFIYAVILFAFNSIVTANANKFYTFLEILISQIRQLFDYKFEVHSFNLGKSFTENLKITDSHMRWHHAIIQMVEQTPRLIIDMVILLTILLIVKFIDNDSLSESKIELMVVAAYASLRLVPVFNNIYANLVKCSRALPAITEVCEVLEARQIKTYPEINEKISSIKCMNISKNFDKREIFSEINLELEIGDKIAITGSSGSGKSTLAKIIAGLEKGETGDFQINSNQLVNVFDNLNWLKKVIYVQQKPVIFKGSIYFNVALGRDIHAKKIINHLSVLGIELSDKQFNEMKPTDFSIGMQQRLCLIRAYFSDADVIIFDEITSGLDKANEDLAISYIKKFFKNRILIIIAHRDKTISACNKKLALEKLSNLSKKNGES